MPACPPTSRLSLLFAALCACAAATAQPQAAPCPAASQTQHADMLGLWRAQVEGRPGAVLLFEQHPVYAQGFRGALDRDGVKALVSGDVDDGQFTLEESLDGLHIAAAWQGDVVEGSCGREIRGTWQAEGDARAWPFTLKKLP